MNLKNGKVFTSKFVGTGPSSYEKRIYRAVVSQRLRNTAVEGHCCTWLLSVARTKSVIFLWTRDQPNADTSNCKTQHSQEKVIHALVGIRTRIPSKREAVNRGFRPAATGIGSILGLTRVSCLHPPFLQPLFVPRKITTYTEGTHSCTGCGI